jgi:hypothetical protein
MNATDKRRLLVAALLGGSVLTPLAAAQDEEKKDDRPTIEKKTEGFERSEGLFPAFRDPKSGALYLEVSEAQLGEEFIAVSYAENGVLEAGAFRGQYRDNRVISIERYYDKLEVVEENTSFYFDAGNALSRAADANVSPAPLASLKIEALTPGEGDAPDRYLIDAGALFLTEALHQVKPSPRPDADPFDFSVGDLAGDRTRYDSVATFPENLDVVVDYVFASPYPRNGGSEAVTDARSVVVTVQHSLIAMPEEGFTPRLDDYRVGYFTERVTDLTDADPAPYRDLVNRWRLVKQDPEAAVSDPVEPIVWWIENTTPLRYRDTVEKAALAWNQAFEKAGFSGAIVVKQQPDDAEWNAGDIRYNVLRWTSSPNPPFGGYGPSFTNPRTGEILGADVMLEEVFVQNRLVVDEIFGYGRSVPAMVPAGEGHCTAGRNLSETLGFAAAALQATGASAEDQDRLGEEGLYYLILHELGHTLGLNHNMKASNLFDAVEIHDRNVTQGLTAGSVMDYPTVNLAPAGQEHGDFYSLRPGPYDDWAIAFGYDPSIDEEEKRAALLARSSERELMFGNDADDMRRPGSGIDPRVMINDLSSEPVLYARDRMDLVRATLPNLLDEFGGEESWQGLVRAFAISIGQYGGQAQVVSRQVGGVYVDRSAPAQAKGEPFKPVPRAQQKQAMETLSSYVFAPDAFDLPQELIVRLQRQRRGFDFFGGTEDPKVHDLVLSIQSGVLAHLTHPVTLQRMTDSSLYGGDYLPSEMLIDLNEAAFGDELIFGSANSFRRNLQLHYLERLAAAASSGAYDPAAKAAAVSALMDVRRRLFFLVDFWMTPEMRAHRLQVKRIVNAGLDGR